MRTRYAACLPAALLLVAVVGFLTAAPADGASLSAGNPQWPGRCPVRIGLLLDQSSSMSGSIDKLHEAADDLVDALRDRPSQVAVIGFGTVARTVSPPVEVSDSDLRHSLQDKINGLGALGGDDGGTNWEGALSAAEPLGLNVVVMVTDGYPTVYGNPLQVVRDDADPAALAAASTVAGRMQAAGTRVVAVGVGLQPGTEGNLARISGPRNGDDYYATDLTDLLHQLYEVAAKACGVPISALPAPDPASFPLRTVLLAAGGVLAVALVIGFLIHRSRSGPSSRAREPAAAGRPGHGVADPTLDHRDLLASASGVDQAREPASPDDLPSSTSTSAGRSLSLDFLTKPPDRN